ncbi:AAA family ATPase [archaeon SCG-AAA382B04]|nr:AAA family ATPase [archaeon SCG-AAA382B04]
MSTTTQQTLSQKFENFLTRYYKNQVMELAKSYPQKKSLKIEFKDLNNYDPELCDKLIEKPDKTINSAQNALKNIDLPIDKKLEDTNIRFIELTKSEKVLARNIRSHHIGQFISLEGIIRKATEVRPKLTKAHFECLRCGHEQKIKQDGNDFKEPYECNGCERKGPFDLNEDKSEFMDSQKIQIQEVPEKLRGGEQPQDINIQVEDDITGKGVPGNRVIINGILRSYQKTNTKGKTNLFDVYVDCNSIEIKEQEFREIEITEQEKEKIIELSQDEEIYQKIIDSIAPSIYGYKNVKEAMTLQLFSGVPKKLPDGSRIRGDIHTLLVGDPGIGKSQILRYVSNLAPRGVYASGKSSTSAGLTAAAVRDEFGDGKWTLEAGALVLADKGIATIDEIDKMDSKDRSALHEAMEQQRISIAKAGITATLQSRCALLGAANPKYGRFDEYEPIGEQIDLEPTLLSRFDLIFTLQDEPDEDEDSKIASHIMTSHETGEISHRNRGTESDSDIGDIEPVIEPDMMRKYIAFSKQVTPVLTPDAKEQMKEFYIDLRAAGEEDESPVPVTARQLEALIRLAEASARTRLSEDVVDVDAKRAINIVKECLKDVGVDPETGEYDIDMLATGTSKSQRDKIRALKEIIDELDQGGSGASKQEVVEEAEDRGISEKDVHDIIQRLREKGDIIEPKTGNLRTA